MQRTRAQWKATEHLHLCSEHFPSDAFHIDSAIAATFGMKKKKPGAVPTLFIRPSAAAQPDSQVDSTRSLKRTTTAQATCVFIYIRLWICVYRLSSQCSFTTHHSVLFHYLSWSLAVVCVLPGWSSASVLFHYSS